MAFPSAKPIPSSSTPSPYIIPHPSFFPHISHLQCRPYTRFNPVSHQNLLRLQLHISHNSKTANSISDEDDSNKHNTRENIEYVEVFGIGSRKDAVLDFCLNSPFLSPALRFWNIVVKDSSKLQLQQRFCNQDMTPTVEAQSELRQSSKAVILVCG
ncbi:hypothetical protein ACH5RR_029672 [Cinchona calisaya]|uniref:Uncharacterized protein n=1 Tax=Cinchona calisaya TaxID=153742 RepID=A0ABD2YTS5_9GENT